MLFRGIFPRQCTEIIPREGLGGRGRLEQLFLKRDIDQRIALRIISRRTQRQAKIALCVLVDQEWTNWKSAIFGLL